MEVNVEAVALVIASRQRVQTQSNNVAELRHNSHSHNHRSEGGGGRCRPTSYSCIHDYACFFHIRASIKRYLGGALSIAISTLQ